MNRKFLLILPLLLLLMACDIKPEKDFTARSQSFMDAVWAGRCRDAETRVGYPVLMDGNGVYNFKQFEEKCNALYTSRKAAFQRENLSVNESKILPYQSGWLKPEFVETHPLLSKHAREDNTYFLLEFKIHENDTVPVSMIFKREVNEDKIVWDIIMIEDYSLTDMMKRPSH